MKKKEETAPVNKITILYYTSAAVVEPLTQPGNCNVFYIDKNLRQTEYLRLLSGTDTDVVMLVDGDKMSLQGANEMANNYLKNEKKNKEVYYYTDRKKRPWLKLFKPSLISVDKEIIDASAFIGKKEDFQQIYAGGDLAGNIVSAAGYSFQKSNLKLSLLKQNINTKDKHESPQKRTVFTFNYLLKIPFFYLFSGLFFKELFRKEARVQREMVYRMLMLFFAAFCYFYMPYISRDYGISGDEFIDDRQSAYVLDYFSKGDKTALDQPKTMLHLYGSSIQIIIKAASDFLHIDDIYGFRHFACSLIGAWGIWIVGLLGLRFGGGLCGILSMVMMFFTPRYFGHSMNNLKDAPFAVGYVMSVYYFIKLFDDYPAFRIQNILGAVIGIFLTLGTRSGGLVLFPYLFMYAGLFYMLRVGIGEFYKFVKYKKEVVRILGIIIAVLTLGYICSIILWPYALQAPLTGVVASMKQFTNINTGLRTIFDGKQMMSNMLPPVYAPKYLMIGMPLITLIGFIGYIVYLFFKRKEFTLLSYFLLFAAIFPVFWVVYQKSNLYGGIRHLLFVMPLMVVIAAKCWTLIISGGKRLLKVAAVIVWFGLLLLPLKHMAVNHPNDYVYFNELVGGLKGVYGDYETDYYFNSLKRSCDWFKKNVEIPKDRKTIIVTQHLTSVAYYFRKDTNVRVIYSRYYEKYSKDWDYAIFGNVYISRFQLQQGLFPPAGALYAPKVDGLPMSYVLKRDTKQDLEGFRLEKQNRIGEAVNTFGEYIAGHKTNEEVWARMAKLYYMTGHLDRADSCADNSLKLHPTLNEALFISALTHIQRKDYKEALSAAQKMLEENESSVDGYYLRALAYFNMENYTAAINDINKALTFRPDYEQALMLAGDIMRVNNDYKQAINIYERILKTRKNVMAMANLADSYCRLKDYNKAETILNEIGRIQAGYFPMYKVLSRMRLMQQRIPEAAQLLAQMNNINTDAELFILRGIYFNAIGNTDTAAKMIDEALKLEPRNKEALNLKRKK